MLAFPSTYTVGITSLGYQVVWATLAQRSDVDVRRLFTDQGDPPHGGGRGRGPNLDLFGLSLILMYSSTEMFDLALAIAILMAVYATLLRMRENREMLVLFASGLGPYQLSALILVVALVVWTN